MVRLLRLRSDAVNKATAKYLILMCGSLVVSGAVIVLVGHLIKSEPMRSWGSAQAMAPSVAVLFLLTGCALIVVGIGRKGNDTNYERRTSD